MKHRIVFFGTEHFATDVLQSLLNDSKKYIVVGVVTQPPRPVGRKQILTASPVHQIATSFDLPLFTPETLGGEEILKNLTDCAADAFVVAQYGLIIPQKILDIPKQGCVNVHASLLPLYRGATPVHTALLKGEKETGVSFMLMDAQMDHGAVFSQYSISIEPTDTTETVLNHLAEKTMVHFPTDLDELITRKITPEPQDHADATFTKILSREDGYLNWKIMDAAHIERMTRAFYSWPGVTTKINDTFVKIITVKIFDPLFVGNPGTVHIEEKRVWIETLKGKLEILILQLAGKQVVTAEQFTRGHRSFDGLTCTDVTTNVSP